MMKNRNLHVFLAAFSAGLVSLPAYVNSQAIFYNKGADIMVNTGALVQVNGGFENAVFGNLTNDGTMYIDDAVSPGDFINSDGKVDGSGDMYIESDWDNTGQFTADATNTSHIEFYGNKNQLIKNGNPVTFWDLETSGSGIKTMQLSDITVSNTLTLNNVELATEDFILYVENPAPSAISNDKTTYQSEGFVSSLTGFLSWDMDQNKDYVFPVGSSTGTKRYREVILKPTTASTCRFMVSMENVDATIDGYDVSQHDVALCKINEKFYHRILRDAGTASVDLSLAFDPSDEGKDWSSSGQWQTEWEKTGTASLTTGTYYTTVTVSAYNNFATDPFALAGISPDAPSITGTPSLCAGDIEAGLYTATGDLGAAYNWSVDGGTIVGDSTGSQINVDWTGSSTATIYLTQTNGIGCKSQPTSMSVTVFSLPVASFEGDTAPFSFVLYSFTDSTIGNNNVSSWEWDFGDGYTSTQQNPYHQYEGPGTYSVQLIVTNENGCVDTILSEVTINEGLVIANTFTPNGDGINDYFMVPSSGITEYHIMVYNRWGTLVFESDAPSVTWDGKTKAGLELPSGTYFYTVNAKAGDSDYSSQGYVELLRGEM
jgi:gliding motility-associated-like protein